MPEKKEQDTKCVNYDVEMTNEEYRIQIQSLVNGIDDNRLLRYFYVYISEKMKRVL